MQILYKPNSYYSTPIYVGTPEIREVSWNGGWGEIDLYAIFPQRMKPSKNENGYRKKNKLMNQWNIPDHHLGALAESEADLGQG